jgi:hypothetical protein
MTPLRALRRCAVPRQDNQRTKLGSVWPFFLAMGGAPAIGGSRTAPTKISISQHKALLQLGETGGEPAGSFGEAAGGRRRGPKRQFFPCWSGGKEEVPSAPGPPAKDQAGDPGGHPEAGKGAAEQGSAGRGGGRLPPGWRMAGLRNCWALKRGIGRRS